MPKKRIGEILLEKRLITQQQLDGALAYHRRSGHRLGTSLVATGAITEAVLCHALAEALGLPEVDLRRTAPEWGALHLLHLRFCEAHDLVPVSIEDHRGRQVLRLAMADPLDLPAIEEVEFTHGVKVVPLIAPLSAVRTAIDFYYRKKAPEPQLSPEEEESGVMTIVGPGGGEMKVTTSTEMGAVRGGMRNEPPVIHGSAIPVPGLRREVTARSALADLIRERAEQRKRRRKGAKSVSDDLSYLTGAAPIDEADELEMLEHRFWTLLRILAKKGIINKEEFLSELDKD